MKTLTIGIAGGSGSGKTTIAQKIIEQVGSERISFLEMDSYYKDLSHMPREERKDRNFDHPVSIDIELFVEHIKMLKQGLDIQKPQYCFINHIRKPTFTSIKAQPVVIVEGILLFENPAVRNEIDIKLFVETPSDIRFIRRLMRDISERGRNPESVVEQYYRTVRPMHLAFVDPSREYADVIVPWQGYNEVAIDIVISRIEQKLKMRREEESFISAKSPDAPEKFSQ